MNRMARPKAKIAITLDAVPTTKLMKLAVIDAEMNGALTVMVWHTLGVVGLPQIGNFPDATEMLRIFDGLIAEIEAKRLH